LINSPSNLNKPYENILSGGGKRHSLDEGRIQTNQFEINPNNNANSGATSGMNANLSFPIRQSFVYLRDEAGDYYQMEEEQYMRLQLDEMQKVDLE